MMPAIEAIAAAVTTGPGCAAAAAAFVHKPFDLDAFLDTIAGLIGAVSAD